MGEVVHPLAIGNGGKCGNSLQWLRSERRSFPGHLQQSPSDL